VGVGDTVGGCCDVWQEVGQLSRLGESKEDDREERTGEGTWAMQTGRKGLGCI